MKKCVMLIIAVGFMSVYGLGSAPATMAEEKAVNLEFISAMAATAKITLLFQDWAKEVD